MEGEQFFGFGTQSGAPGNNPEIPVIFFSRRIGLENGGVVPIVGGGRLLGRSGRNQIGVLQMRTGDVPALSAVATDFTAMRVQREILRRSRIGMIATRRAPSANGSTNYAYGVDAVFQFYQNIQFVHYLAKTETRGRNGNDLSSRNRFVWNADRWGIDTEHMFAGEDFNPEMGFLRRPEGFQHLKGSFRFSPRPRNIPGVRKVFYSVNVQYFTDPTWDKVESRDQQATFRTDFTSGDRTQIEVSRTYEAIEEPFTLAKGVRVPAGGYSWQQLQGSFTFGPQRKISGTAVAMHGSFYDGTVTEVELEKPRRVLAAVLRRADDHGEPRRHAVGARLFEPREQPPHLHADAADVRLGAGAVPDAHRFGLHQRALPLGIPPRQRALRRLQRRSLDADARHPRRPEPQLRRQGHPPVPVLGSDLGSDTTGADPLRTQLPLDANYPLTPLPLTPTTLDTNYPLY